MVSAHSETYHFLHKGMMPRSWRMIFYSCIGAFLYGGVILCETLQNFQFNKIDQEIKSINQMQAQISDEPKNITETFPPSDKEN